MTAIDKAALDPTQAFDVKRVRADFPILDLKVNAPAGVYDVVGLTNWRSAAANRTLNFAEKLGLDAGREYLVFDFWKQELLGSFKDSLQVDVGPHDTRVLAVHPRLDHPQLVGNSRHISGAQSIAELGWDTAAKRLKGTSETIAGEPYTLYVHVPPGYKLATAKGVVGSKPGLVTLMFQGQNEPIRWELQFE